jgi:hypothetical protein
MENLARYIIRASFSPERMQYLGSEGSVIYSAKSSNDRKVFDALEWVAPMCSHIPNRGEQMVRMINISAAQARPLVDHINEMLAALKKLGPSPLMSTNPSKNAEMRI